MNKDKNFDWRAVQEKAQMVLGEDFWNDINRVIPKYGPDVDCYRKDGDFVVIIEAPGISSVKEITIKIKGLKMTISGKIPWTYPIGEKEILQRERFIGEFKREINLPNDINLSRVIDAKSINGLIEVRIPVMQVEEEKEIPIEFVE